MLDRTTIQAFWNWFIDHEPALFALGPDREALFDELEQALGLVDRGLTFEFGPVEHGKREFVVTADGIRQVFPAVEALVAAAPALGRWTVTAFRPRRETVCDVEFQGVSVRARDVWAAACQDGEKVGVVVFMSAYQATKKETLSRIAYLMLDEALGEYVVETEIGFIEVRDAADRPPQALAIGDLWKLVDQIIRRRRTTRCS